MDAKNAQIQSSHLKQQCDLKKQISDLKAKLDSVTYGRRAESEMYEEAMVKTQRLETMANELNAKVIFKFQPGHLDQKFHCRYLMFPTNISKL